ALHDFDVVSAVILRRQHAVARARGRRDALHLAVEVSVQGVDMQLDRLARMHALKLRLAKIGGYPKSSHLSNPEQRLARADAVADVGGTFAHHARYRRAHSRVTKIELGLCERSSRGIHTRLSQLHLRALGLEHV